MSFLSERERRALAMICETLIPPIVTQPHKPQLSNYNPTRTDDLINRLEEAYEKAIDESARRELKLLLSAFESAFFNGVMSGRWTALSGLSATEREQVLLGWADSRLFLRRKAFQGIKRLALFLAYSNPPEGTHPIWSEIGYPGAFTNQTPQPRPITPMTIESNITLTTEVLIIGSGAGGGVVAGELSQAGFEVMVVEKGNYYADHEMDGNERKSTQEMYEKYGALTTQDTALMVLAGSTLGGGTTINWAGSLRTPPQVLEEWSREYGFTQATSPEYEASIQAVSQRLNVNSDECALNGNNAQFAKGCEALGYPVEIIPRNVKGCEDCGFCNFGCTFGAKQSTAKTYLQDAHQRGAKILVKAQVLRVTHEHGVANGAIVRVDNGDKTHTVMIKAKAVIVSGGSINTPAILKRSGLQNPHIGANLHLHPVTVIFSLFDEPIRTWQGAPMTRVTKKFTNMDGKGYGVVLEVAPAHPGLTASVLPWVSGAEHKRLVGNMQHMANVICIARDYYGGHVKLDKQGDPILAYQLHPYDRAHLQKGVLEALKIHQAAGATEIYSPHNAQVRFVNDGTQDFGAFLAKVESLGLQSNAYPLFSAHQMSSCRIGGNASLGAVKPNGETYEIRNLFVVDGSALPTATGVNPMLSILSLAHYLAQQIKAQLRH
jgi:choline dehydrogenase-like flavoprotein